MSKSKKLFETKAILKPFKLNEKGYAVATDDEDRTVWVLNALPGETVEASFYKRRRKVLYAKAEKVIEASPFRQEEKDHHFLTSSPWQILELNQENKVKTEQIEEHFEKAFYNLKKAEIRRDAEEKSAEKALNEPQKEVSEVKPKIEAKKFEARRIQPEKKELTTEKYLEILENQKNFEKLQIETVYPEDLSPWFYRNKVEFSFFGHDDETVTFAFFMRGSSMKKLPFKTSSIIEEKMNIVGQKILELINEKNITARELKSLIMRHSKHEDKVVAGIFVKNEDLNLDKNDLEKLFQENQDILKGISIFFSNPLSPASVATKDLITVGQTSLQEKICNLVLEYDFSQFFQINTKAFEQTGEEIKNEIKKIIQENEFKPKQKLEKTLESDLEDILNLDSLEEGAEEVNDESETKNQLEENPEKFQAQIPENSTLPTILDLYSGVGTIGLLVADQAKKLVGVEVTPGTAEKAYKNAKANNIKNVEFKEETVENSLEYIEEADILIIDPPRAGMSQSVVNKILNCKPKFILYLSCNPQSQAENYGDLSSLYKINYLKGFNFYPHTPHAESLMILELKQD